MPFVSNSVSHVVLSPHPDDAVLSLGACIAAWRRNGDAVEVITLFDGAPSGPLTPAAIEDRSRYSSDPVELRREEDLHALTFLDATLDSLGMQELVYRLRPDGQPRCASLDDIYGPLNDDDNGVISEVTNALVARRENWPANAVIHVPLSTGGHSDHRVVRIAAEQALEAFEFYDDLPYAIRLSTHNDSVSWPVVTADDLDRWITAIRFYDSQLDNLFGGDETWPQQFHTWAQLYKGA